MTMIHTNTTTKFLAFCVTAAVALIVFLGFPQANPPADRVLAPSSHGIECDSFEAPGFITCNRGDGSIVALITYGDGAYRMQGHPLPGVKCPAEDDCLVRWDDTHHLAYTIPHPH